MPNTNSQFSEQNIPNIDRLVSQSTFIFKGEIKKIGDSTFSFGKITENQNIATVKVTEVLHSHEILGDSYSGKEITIRLLNPSKEDIGHQVVFFTYPWIYGNEGIAVEEAGRLKEENTSNIRNQIADVIQKLADKEMETRIAEANLIVIGKVTSISGIKRRENDPDKKGEAFEEDEKVPYQANIEVEEVIKGNLPTKEIKILFDNNMDFSSYKAPKFEGKEHGIFFLHRDEDQNREYHTAFNQGDFQSIDNLERIKKLVKSSTGEGQDNHLDNRRMKV
jgi:hypothetical protein